MRSPVVKLRARAGGRDTEPIPVRVARAQKRRNAVLRAA